MGLGRELASKSVPVVAAKSLSLPLACLLVSSQPHAHVPPFVQVEREEVAGGDEEAAADADAPTVLGIGVDGGFALEADKYEIVRHDAVVVMPSKQSVPLGTEGIPDAVSLCVAAIMEYDDDSTKADIAAWTEAPIQVRGLCLCCGLFCCCWWWWWCGWRWSHACVCVPVVVAGGRS